MHQVLKHEVSQQPALGGVGVLGLDAALPRVAAFVRVLSLQQREEEAEAEVGGASASRCACSCHERKPQLYFASVDVERCYDHIRPQGLLTLLRGACARLCRKMMTIIRLRRPILPF